MKIYNLQRGDRFKVIGAVFDNPTDNNRVWTFGGMDGAFAKVLFPEEGFRMFNLYCSTEVVKV